MQTTTVQNGAAKLAITTWGSEGTPIVALHPGVGDSRIWQWCAPVWADSGHLVVAYDRRGFGGTRYEREPHDDLADLLAVTAATDSRPAVIIGNSRGGGLALDLALAHPNHVTGMVLITPSPSGYPEDDWPTSAAEVEQDQLIEAASESGNVDLTNRLEVRYWLDGVDQPEGRVAGPARNLMVQMNGQALRAEAVGPTAERPAVWPRLDQITVPVLIVAGEHDLIGIRQLCTRLNLALPNSRLETIRNSAHCPSLDQPQHLNRLVLEFLESIAS